MSETERDSGWSEQYAETGGWPPPAADQRRYDPGATSLPATPPPAAADPAAAHPAAAVPAAADPADPAGAGHQAIGQPEPLGQPTDAGRWTSWGQPANPANPATPAEPGPANQRTQAGPGGAGPSPSPWAPGDPAYGRLEPGTPQQRQRPRRPWDGRPAPAPVRRPAGATPVVTYTLIGICVVVYLLQQANPSFTARYALIPYAVEQGQYARLITSAFLHAGLLHLATNMITLYIVGVPLERVLRPARYLAVYVLSALGGSLLSVWLSPEFSVGVGASGAIFGLFGALVVLRRQVGAEAGGLVVLIGLNLVISFAVPNISWQAHLGGLVTGVLVALALKGVDRLSRRPVS